MGAQKYKNKKKQKKLNQIYKPSDDKENADFEAG